MEGANAFAFGANKAAGKAVAARRAATLERIILIAYDEVWSLLVGAGRNREQGVSGIVWYR
jgi:hypothetical protein